MSFIVFAALGVAAFLFYKVYLRQLLAQGKAGRIKIGLVALGFVFLALALTGRAPALFALVGAAMTQAMRFGPLLIKFAPGIKKHFDGNGRSPFANDARQSRVSSATLAMTLDHDSGEMTGEVLSGEFAGRQLAELSAGEIVRLHAWCRANDEDALRLLEAYVARERANEFDNAEELGGQSHRSSTGGSTGDGHGQRSGSDSEGRMSLDEARNILGVTEDADRDAIIAAHRLLMSRLHPDKGGSDYLASKVNAARQQLLGEMDER